MSNVALTTSVVMVTLSESVEAGVAAGTLLAVEAAAVAVGAGKFEFGKFEFGKLAEVTAGGVTAGAGFVTATGLNSDGLPLALFQPSYSKNNDIEKTTHSRVRRISFMGQSFQGRAAEQRERNSQKNGVFGQEPGHARRDKTGDSVPSGTPSNSCLPPRRDALTRPVRRQNSLVQIDKSFPATGSAASGTHEQLPSKFAVDQGSLSVLPS